MNRIVLLSLVVLSPIGTIGTVGVLAPLRTGNSIGLLSVVGSKISRAESRTTKEFDWIDFSELENVRFYLGSPASLGDMSDENLLDLVETIVEDRALKIRFTNSFSIGVAPETSSIASAGGFALNNPILVEAANKEMRINRKSRFKMSRDGLEFCADTSLGRLSARNRSHPRQPRVSKLVAKSDTINGCDSAAIDASKASDESDDPAGETAADDEEDH